jgi:hypothetical protein
LIRRVYYDLIGLPPTPQQIDDFQSDDSPDAYENLVDQLLQSHHFGERWGRHWLDVVRFAESSGGGRTLLFPNAWRYRDYVIEAFNRDLPYDQFLKEQIAGDLLDYDDWRDKRRKMVATAFLLIGPTNYELQDKDMLEMDVVDEQVDTIGKSMLGMTIGCARCHDHKFDPIPADDYYALAGILKSTKAMIHSNVSQWNKEELPLPPEEEKRVFELEQKQKSLRDRIAKTKQRIDAIEGKSKSKEPKREANIKSETIDGIVVDDESAEQIGQWISSTSISRYVDGKYIHDERSDKGKKQVVFRPEVPVAGRYEVRVAYTASTNRSSRVPVHVHHVDGESVVRVNQRVKPEIEGAYSSVGIFAFAPEHDSKIVISNEGTEDGVVIADAIVLIPSDLPPLPTADQVDLVENIPFIVQDSRKLPGIVIDDLQAKLVGEWKHSVHTPPFVGVSYLHDEMEGKGEKSATFEPELPADGLYEVRVAHNTNVRRANSVPITVVHAEGETKLTINEAKEPPIDKLFRSLGEFRFKKGRHGSVTIFTNGTDGKHVIVDAVQFIPIDADQQLKRSQLAKLRKEIKTLEADLKKIVQASPGRPIAMVADDDSDAGDIHVAIRGIVHNRGPIVKRGVMQVAANDARPEIAEGESGRRELADWIASDQNPLTARVMANRIWHWLVGRGIVESVDNFGRMGTTPTHPELLDYLATSFINNGWSSKNLIREIVLSKSYRLSTNSDSNLAAIDPDNRLLWRMNRKRLHAEDIRDTLLLVGGSLDTTAGGSNIRPGTRSEYHYQFSTKRRSVYVPVFRNRLPEIFEVFDFADPNIQRGVRTRSTIASQALLMMNHPMVIEQSRKAAEQLLATNPTSDASGVEIAYLQVLGRQPTTEERRISVEFTSSDSRQPETRWALLYQTLFESADFRYLH